MNIDEEQDLGEVITEVQLLLTSAPHHLSWKSATSGRGKGAWEICQQANEDYSDY
jgi:hypothetical protein